MSKSSVESLLRAHVDYVQSFTTIERSSNDRFTSIRKGKQYTREDQIKAIAKHEHTTAKKIEKLVIAQYLQALAEACKQVDFLKELKDVKSNS